MTNNEWHQNGGLISLSMFRITGNPLPAWTNWNFNSVVLIGQWIFMMSEWAVWPTCGHFLPQILATRIFEWRGAASDRQGKHLRGTYDCFFKKPEHKAACVRLLIGVLLIHAWGSKHQGALKHARYCLDLFSSFPLYSKYVYTVTCP